MANTTAQAAQKPALPGSILALKCPRCRRGNMFLKNNPYQIKHSMDMHEHCPKCGQNFEPQIGFYYGTGYVSYGLSVALSVASFLCWAIFPGFSLKNNSLFYWLGSNILLLIILQPVLMRLARTIWLAFFVRYDENWNRQGGIKLTAPVEQPALSIEDKKEMIRQ